MVSKAKGLFVIMICLFMLVLVGCTKNKEQQKIELKKEDMIELYESNIKYDFYLLVDDEFISTMDHYIISNTWILDTECEFVSARGTNLDDLIINLTYNSSVKEGDYYHTTYKVGVKNNGKVDFTDCKISKLNFKIFDNTYSIDTSIIIRKNIDNFSNRTFERTNEFLRVDCDKTNLTSRNLVLLSEIESNVKLKKVYLLRNEQVKLDKTEVSTEIRKNLELDNGGINIVKSNDKKTIDVRCSFTYNYSSLTFDYVDYLVFEYDVYNENNEFVRSESAYNGICFRGDYEDFLANITIEEV